MPPFEILELGKKILFTGFSVKLVLNQELDEDHVSISTDVYSLATFIDCNFRIEVLSSCVCDYGSSMVMFTRISIVVALCMEREFPHRVS